MKTREFFEELVRLMIRSGFVLISQVQISTDDLPHHTRTTFARATSFFFHVPAHSFVIHLLYDEDDFINRGKIAGHWDITCFLQYKNYDTLRELITGSKFYLRPDLSQIPFLETAPKISGFTNGETMQISRFNDLGCLNRYKLHQELEEAGKTDIRGLVRSLKEINEAVRPYLAREFNCFRGQELVPQHLFPGCGKIFWERFHKGHPPGYLYCITRKVLK